MSKSNPRTKLSLREEIVTAVSKPPSSSAEEIVTRRFFVEYAFVTEAGIHDRLRAGVIHAAFGEGGSMLKRSEERRKSKPKGVRGA